MNNLSVKLLFGTVLLACNAWGGDTWPQFRGPHGNGHSDARGLPLSWSEERNVKWKTPIHGKAWSSPVIWGDQVWLTTATEDGKELFVVCVDRASGKVLRDQKLYDIEKPQFCHKFNSYASPTPVIEEGRVYVTFGAPGTACLDTQTGKVLWERRDFECNHYRSAGSSPILHGDLLIMHFDGSDHQFIVALDKKTGKTAWRVERSIDFKDLGPDGKPETEGDFRKAFATPHVATLGDKPVLLSSGAKAHYAYEPLTGKELWRVEERTCHSCSSRPVAGNGLVYFLTGWSSGQLLALQPGGNGEVIDANTEAASNAGTQLKLAWKSKRSIARKPSLILVNDLIFMIEDGGVATCLKAKTGQQVWNERVGGNYSASPLLAEGRIYFCSEEGKTTVIEAGRQFKVLAENQLKVETVESPAGFMGSPAAVGQALFLRTRTHLYRIEE
ncbi:MAG: PQQ-binding-like beta-propeller repeat protein [Verrucomicrobia bacterium]|nr:PQQ-binding-like beta-propeller repeat protein [Verrucomicrobiota bacterium]